MDKRFIILGRYSNTGCLVLAHAENEMQATDEVIKASKLKFLANKFLEIRYFPIERYDGATWPDS